MIQASFNPNLSQNDWLTILGFMRLYDFLEYFPANKTGGIRNVKKLHQILSFSFIYANV